MAKRSFKVGDAVVFEPATLFDATYYLPYGVQKGMTGRVATVSGYKGHSIWADPLKKLLFVAWYAPDGQTISIGTAVESVRKVAGGKAKASRHGTSSAEYRRSMKQNPFCSSRGNGPPRRRTESPPATGSGLSGA